MPLTIKPGLEVGLNKFAYEYAYEGILEGDPDYINRMILEKGVPKLAAHKLFSCNSPEGLPIYVQKPAKRKSDDKSDWRFPRYICFALLHGPKVEGRPDPDDEWSEGSRVAYCWFTDDVSRPIQEIVAAGLAPFDWNAVAENWGF
jgi:hypothetical protein